MKDEEIDFVESFLADKKSKVIKDEPLLSIHDAPRRIIAIRDLKASLNWNFSVINWC